MQAKRPTYSQKKFLSSRGYNPFEYLVIRETADFLRVVKKDSGETADVYKKIKKHK